MFLFVLTLHFILCAILICLVLIQQGKGADMGAAFGAGGSNSLFGAGGATSLIVRVTTATAVAFMITSIVLINLSGSESGLAAVSAVPGNNQSLAGSVMEGVAATNPTAASSEANPVVPPTSGMQAATENQAAPANPADAAPQAAPNVTAEVKQESK